MTPGDEFCSQLHAAVSRVVLGKAAAIELAITALIAGGHLLIEDHPGLGKTLLARSLARALGLPFQRVQCTADLLPADILGAQIYQPKSGEITFRPGPVFTSVLVADELNRTPPRTQSALLECMAERCVTIDRTTMPLPAPFFVVATQNPFTASGTYPLPENQLDRFMMRLRLGYAEAEQELAVLGLEDGHRHVAQLPVIGSAERLLAKQQEVDRVTMHRDLAARIVELARRTRDNQDIVQGISSRGAQALYRASRALALVRGRTFVVPEDLRLLLEPVWAHRLQLRRGADARVVLEEISAEVPIPE